MGIDPSQYVTDETLRNTDAAYPHPAVISEQVRRVRAEVCMYHPEADELIRRLWDIARPVVEEARDAR